MYLVIRNLSVNLGGSIVDVQTKKLTTQSVGYEFTSKALVFGGEVTTASDIFDVVVCLCAPLQHNFLDCVIHIVVAHSLESLEPIKIGDPVKVNQIDREVIHKVYPPAPTKKSPC